jgi:hypothetical protein
MKILTGTTQQDAEALYAALDATRPSSRHITVPRQAFAHLLTDHGMLVRSLQNSGHSIEAKSGAAKPSTNERAA